MSEPAETAEKPAEEKPIEEAKPEKKKSKGIYAHYEVEEGKLKRLLPFCERCGPGYFMANHGDRYTCGHCGFTRYKPAETSE
ncbi:MAG: 30S ribosomal protein S27ae [Candidatus Bathyarchaeia archaeon]